MKYISDEIKLDYPFDGEGPFYTDYYGHLQTVYDNFGIIHCNWNETLYPNLARHKARLVERFDNEYKFREIGQETGYRFMHYLQLRLDEVAEHFDHMYNVFDNNNVDELGTGYKDIETYHRDRSTTIKDDGTNTKTTKMDTITDSTNTLIGSTTDTGEGTDKFKDTPITGRINNPTNENITTSSNNTQVNNKTTDKVTDGKNGTETDVKDNTELTTDNDDYTKNFSREIHEEHMIDELNRLADRYKSVDNEFIKEFNEMFMGIGYIEV